MGFCLHSSIIGITSYTSSTYVPAKLQTRIKLESKVYLGNCQLTAAEMVWGCGALLTSMVPKETQVSATKDSPAKTAKNLH